MTRIYIAILAFLFPAFLSAQAKTFAGTDYSQGIVFVMENNQIVWQHKAPDSNDLWVLPNGNILFTTGHGVLEMTRQNDTIFHYESKKPGLCLPTVEEWKYVCGRMYHRPYVGNLS